MTANPARSYTTVSRLRDSVTTSTRGSDEYEPRQCRLLNQTHTWRDMMKRKRTSWRVDSHDNVAPGRARS